MVILQDLHVAESDLEDSLQDSGLVRSHLTYQMTLMIQMTWMEESILASMISQGPCLITSDQAGGREERHPISARPFLRC